MASKEERDRKLHWNSTWDADKWREFIELIKMDVTRKNALSHVWLPDSTLTDRLWRDEKLSAEYERAKTFMDIASWQVIAEAIIKQKDVKTALEYKRRRDDRYKDKQSIDHTSNGKELKNLTDKQENAVKSLVSIFKK